MTSTDGDNAILTFSDHDRNLLVWGVVVDDHSTVRACRDNETATRAADAAGPITVTTAYTVNTEPRTTHCSRLVYHHTDLGWVFAAIGHPVAITHQADTS